MRMMKLSYTPLLCLLFVAVVFGERNNADGNTYETELKALDVLLSRGKDVYDPRMPPGKGDDSPLEVRVNVMLTDIMSVNDLKNELSIQFEVGQKWKDPRLAFRHFKPNLKYIRVHNSEKIWKPDTFFVDEREGKLHTILFPSLYMMINPDGEIFYSQRVSMTFRCNMDLRYYPLDSQKCSFMIEGLFSKSHEIKYRCKNSSDVGVSDDITMPVSMINEIDMPDFVVTDQTCISKDVDLGDGIYSRLQTDLTFKRKIGFFMNKLYVPFIILVIASWLSFWIKPHFTSLRLTLILTILFIMFWLQQDVSRQTPPVSYTKALDVWTGVCLSLVFASFLQTILISQMVKREKHRKKHEGAVDSEALFTSERNEGKSEKCSSLDQAEVKSFSKLITGRFCEGKRLDNKVDIFSRLLYPIIFGVFNLIYWPVYCSGS